MEKVARPGANLLKGGGRGMIESQGLKRICSLIYNSVCIRLEVRLDRSIHSIVFLSHIWGLIALVGYTAFVLPSSIVYTKGKSSMLE
jgi:hypothetical protein